MERNAVVTLQFEGFTMKNYLFLKDELICEEKKDNKIIDALLIKSA